VFAMPYMISEEDKNSYRFLMLDVQSSFVYRPVFLYFTYESKLLNQFSVTLFGKTIKSV
jgi:hypothetical protein